MVTVDEYIKLNSVPEYRGTVNYARTFQQET